MMETKDYAILIGLGITVAGVIVGITKSIINGATIKDLYELERKIEAKLDDKSKQSVESHSGLVSRREFEQLNAQIDRRLTSIEGSVTKLDSTVDVRLGAIDKVLTDIKVQLVNTNAKGGQRG